MEEKRTAPVETAIVDTSVFIDFLRQILQAKYFFKNFMQQKNILFSAITETELLAGEECNRPEKREQLLHFLSLFTKVNVDNKIAQLAGDIRRKYGTLTPDSIIAATALSEDAVLYTRDRKDFEKIKEVHVINPY